jgi:hydroxyquinol 1,2-dioxygenase
MDHKIAAPREIAMSIRNFNEDTLTAEVLRRLEGTKNPRLKEVMESFVKHLHAFVREVRPTQKEWFTGIKFLAEVGHWCDDKRHEFILMSDTLGVSMLVDFINYGSEANCTESTVLGPFFVEGAPELPLGASMAKPGTPGEPCVVTGTIKAPDGTPIAGAVLDAWEGDGDGFYDVQKDGGTNLRARYRTDSEGRFWLKCVRPVSYPVPHDGPVGELLQLTGRHPMRPGHLHTLISAKGYETLVTHLFTKGDPYLDSDAVFGVKESLIVDFVKCESKEEAEKFGMPLPFYRAHYDFVLKPSRQPAREAAARREPAPA